MPKKSSGLPKISSIVEIKYLNLLVPGDNPEINTRRLIDFYKKISATSLVALEYNSFVQLFLYKCRRTADNQMGLLQLDFSQTEILVAYALGQGHISVAMTLLTEQYHSWGNDHKKIVQGSLIKDDKNNWLTLLLTLATQTYHLYQEDETSQNELKEFLQRTLSLIVDVLKLHPNLKDTLPKLYAFAKGLEDVPVIPVNVQLCVYALLSYFDKEKTIQKLPIAPQIARLIEQYGLSKNALSARRSNLDLIKDKKEPPAEKIPELKQLIKARFNLALIMNNPLLYQDMIHEQSNFCLDVILEAITDSYFKFPEMACDRIIFLSRHLDKKQIFALTTHILSIYPEGYQTYFLASREKSTIEQLRNIENYHYKLLAAFLNLVGSYSDQIKFLFEKLHDNQVEKRITSNIINYAFRGVTLFHPRQFMNFNKRVTLPDEAHLEFKQHPIIKKEFANHLAEFRYTVLTLIKRHNNNQEIMGFSFWLAYLSAMWMQFFGTPTENQYIFSQLDYILELTINNQNEFPIFYQSIQQVLIENNYFSNKKLEYFLKYRFDPKKRQQTNEIQVCENRRKEKNEPVFIADENPLLQPPLSHSLLSLDLTPVLSAALKAQDSIFKKLDFLNQWLDWGKSTNQIKVVITISDQIILYVSTLPLIIKINELLFKGYAEEGQIPDFSRSEMEDTLAILLFFYQQKDEILLCKQSYTLLIEKLRAFDVFCELRPQDTGNFNIIYDIMAKHRFFENEAPNLLASVFFDRVTMPEIRNYIAKQFINPPIEIEAAPIVPLENGVSKKKRKKNKPKTKESVPEESSIVEPDPIESAPVEPTPVEPAPVESVPVEPAPVESVPVESVPVESVPVESVPESVQEESAEKLIQIKPHAKKKSATKRKNQPSKPTAAPPVPIIIAQENNFSAINQDKQAALEVSKIYAQRQTCQKIALLLNQFKEWNETHNKDIPLPSKKLHERLEQMLQTYRDVRKLLKKGAPEVKIDESAERTTISETNIKEQFKLYETLVEQLSDLPEASALGNLSYLELRQPDLYRRLKLPEKMPVIEHIDTLFAPYAECEIYGSALFLKDPLDSDIRIVWNSNDSIQEIKNRFMSIMHQAGFSCIFVCDLHWNKDLKWGASFKVNAKGDGYTDKNHKEIGFTLLIQNPDLRPEQIHYNSFSSAALHIRTRFIKCDPRYIDAIINNTYILSTDNPVSSSKLFNFKKDVQNLTTLMRAWSEDGCILSPSSNDLIERISRYQGDWYALNQNDPELEKALRGTIMRHVDHHQRSETYEKRTDLFLRFLQELNIFSASEQLIVELQTTIRKNFTEPEPCIQRICDYLNVPYPLPAYVPMRNYPHPATLFSHAPQKSLQQGHPYYYVAPQ